jgi:hypothetical protein
MFNKWSETMRLSLLATAGAVAFAAPVFAADADWNKKVDTIIGKTDTQTGNVHRYGLPRSDLKVTLDGVDIKPGLALGGWVAFQDMGNSAMMMGDLVLTEAEINPVMAKLLEEGIEVTAVHNHLLRASPATFYMHVGGHGDPLQLAQSVRDALALSKTPFDPPTAVSAPAPDLGLDTAKIDEAIGFKGRNNGGIYAFGVPRSDEIKADGMAVPGAMGSAVAINFQPTGNGKAAITGDFVATAKEVVPLLKALRSNGIEVTAVHNHMLDDEPRAFFVHFWANDDAVKLAQGLRAGLDAVHVAKKG